MVVCAGGEVVHTDAVNQKWGASQNLKSVFSGFWVGLVGALVGCLVALWSYDGPGQG